MTKCEYDKVIKPVLKSHFENINEIFTTDTLPTEFDNFLETNKDLSRKSIFELVFRISTAYIKKILDLPVNNSILSSGEKLILYNLYEIHQSFTLGLFTNNNQVLVNNYSSSYKVIDFFHFQMSDNFFLNSLSVILELIHIEKNLIYSAGTNSCTR